MASNPTHSRLQRNVPVLALATAVLLSVLGGAFAAGWLIGRILL